MKFSTLVLAIIGFSAPATAFTSFADAMSGGVKPPKPATYGPGGGAKPQAYQAPVAPPVVSANSADVHSQAAPANGFSRFPGGGAAPVKAGGYGPSKGPYKVAAPAVGSYLDAVAGGGGGGAPAQAASAPAAAAPASGFPGSGAAPVKAGGYGPSKGPYKVAAPAVGSYLDAVSGSAPVQNGATAPTAYSQPAAPGAPGGGAAPVKAGGYGPSKGPYKVAAPAIGSYLDAVSGTAPVQNGATAPAASSQPVAPAAPPTAPVKAGGWGPSKGAYKVAAPSVGSYLDSF